MKSVHKCINVYTKISPQKPTKIAKCLLNCLPGQRRVCSDGEAQPDLPARVLSHVGEEHAGEVDVVRAPDGQEQRGEVEMRGELQLPQERLLGPPAHDGVLGLDASAPADDADEDGAPVGGGEEVVWRVSNSSVTSVPKLLMFWHL